MTRSGVLIAATLVAAGCFNFASDRATCDVSGPCRAPPDGGSAGGAAGGLPGDDGGCGAAVLAAVLPSRGPCNAEFCWEYPPLTGNQVQSIWSDCREVWAVADRSTLLHFDGQRWNVSLNLHLDAQGAAQRLNGVSGNRRAVLVAGDDGYVALMALDGGATLFGTPCSGCSYGPARAAGNDEFWLAHDNGPLHRIDAHGNSTDFGPVPAPGHVSDLFAVSRDEAWLVDDQKVLHLVDGGFVTSPLSTGGDGQLVALSLGPDHRLWVAAQFGAKMWSGDVSTEPVAFSMLPPTVFQTHSIATTASGQRYLAELYADTAVCTSAGACRAPTAGLALTTVFSPPGTEAAFGGGTENGMFFTQDGTGWQTIQGRLDDVMSLLPLGDGGLVAFARDAVLVSDGDGGWSRRATTATFSDFSGSWLDGDRTLWVTSDHRGGSSPGLLTYNLATQAHPSATLVHSDLTAFGSDPALNAIDGNDAGAYAVGGRGLIFMRQGARWVQVDGLPSTIEFNGVFVDPTGAAIAVGTDGGIVRLSGNTVTGIASPVPRAAWWAVAGATVDDFYLGGDDDRLFHYADAGWSNEPLDTATGNPSPLSNQTTGVLVFVGGPELWIGRSDGVLLHRRAPNDIVWVRSGLEAPAGEGTITDIEAIAVVGGRVYVGCRGGGFTSVPLP